MACRRLQVRRGAAAVRLLCRLLTKDPEVHVRHEAAYALKELADKRALPALLVAARDPQSVCKDLIYALRNIGGQRAVQALADALDNMKHGGSVARLAEPLLIEALAEFGGRDAVDPLIRALDNSDHLTTIIDCLDTIGDPRSEQPILRALIRECRVDYIAERLGHRPDVRALPRLIHLLETLDYNWQQVRAIGQILYEQAGAAKTSELVLICKRVSSPSECEVRRLAETELLRRKLADALKQRPESTTWPLLATDDVNDRRRAADAVAGLGTIALPLEADVRKRIQSEPEPSVRLSIYDALRRMGAAQLETLKQLRDQYEALPSSVEADWYGWPSHDFPFEIAALRASRYAEFTERINLAAALCCLDPDSKQREVYLNDILEALRHHGDKDHVHSGGRAMFEVARFSAVSLLAELPGAVAAVPLLESLETYPKWRERYVAKAIRSLKGAC